MFQSFTGNPVLGLTMGVPSGENLWFWVFNGVDGVLGQSRQNAFGVVFSNAGLPASASLNGRVYAGNLVPSFHFDSPANENAQSFSFVGVIYPDTVFNSTVIYMSELLASPIALDEVILGAAPPLPEPSTSLLFLVGGIVLSAVKVLGFRRSSST
jgi:hypothetical protein